MKSWIYRLVKLCLGVFFTLTSLYCLLAFIPYTFFFLIKEPPYAWLIAFARYHTVFYWVAVAAAFLVYWPQRKRPLVLLAWALLVATSTFFTVRNFLPNIQNNWTAFTVSLTVLIPMLLLATEDILGSAPLNLGNTLLSYSNAVVVALSVAALSAGGVFIRIFFETGALGISFRMRSLEMMIYILATYLWLALLVVSITNLLTLAANRVMTRVRPVRLAILNMIAFLALFAGSVRFLQDMLNFRGWPAWLYGAVLAAALVAWSFTVLRPQFDSGNVRRQKAIAWVVLACAAAAALLVPASIGERDWNGVIQYTFTLLFWIALSIAVYTTRSRPKTYSLAAVLAVLLLAGSIFWGIKATAFLWARQVGTTDGDIVRAAEDYASQNVSFDLAFHWMGAGQTEDCGEQCLVLRQYANIPHPVVNVELKLVDPLTQAREMRPNIFIVVIDSLRRDYVGAYNPHVDFTPNLDAFARDSVVIPNAYTQYAGTSLSEPAIWAGALLLHSHHLDYFPKVNSLEKLLNVDGYRMIVSYDEVLRQMLSDNKDLVKLDGDKRWNELEIGSTIRQLKGVLENGGSNERPIFFYTQPKNVHQFGVNDRPLPTAKTWSSRLGFSYRISYELHQVDESLGDFFSYLKSRGLYDNSVIVLTSDHGDATQGSGRLSHSTIIYPEVMQVPLIIHLPKSLRNQMVYDPAAVASLTDITPTLYYLLGYQHIEKNPLFGRPLLANSLDELRSYSRNDLFLASDARAAFGLLTGDGRYMYVIYDSPAQSLLFDLVQDPDATQNILTDALNKKYDQRVIDYLQAIAEFYGYKPAGIRRQ